MCLLHIPLLNKIRRKKFITPSPSATYTDF
nr:MAG TPA: hypothetical protein [Caudoviricetes sp.]